MGIYDGYLLLSDIDGTLTTREGDVSTENLRAIRHFQSEGGAFALATGRMPDYITRYPFRSNAPTITINGTLVVSPEGETLLSLPMEEDFADVIHYIMKNHPDIYRVNRVEEKGYKEWLRAQNSDYRKTLLSGNPCFKFVAVCRNEAAAARLMENLSGRYGDRYEFDRSWSVGVEMHAKGSGKATCLRHLRTIIPHIHTVIAVGDYENDIPMLKEADIGCAVGNAIPAVKAVADRVIVPNTEHAIAYIVEQLIPSLVGNKTK